MDDSGLNAGRDVPIDFYDDLDTKKLGSLFEEISLLLEKNGFLEISKEFQSIRETLSNLRYYLPLMDDKMQFTLYRITSTAKIFKSSIRDKTYISFLKSKEEQLHSGILRRKSKLSEKRSFTTIRKSFATEGFCIKCKAKRDLKNVKQIAMKTARPSIMGICGVCGSKIFKVGSSIQSRSKKAEAINQRNKTRIGIRRFPSHEKPMADDSYSDRVFRGQPSNIDNSHMHKTPEGEESLEVHRLHNGGGVTHERNEEPLHRRSRPAPYAARSELKSQFQRYPEVSFPETVKIGKKEQLQVKIVTTRQNQFTPGLLLSFGPHAKNVVVQVNLSIDSHFKNLNEKYYDLINVPIEEEQSGSITFDLEAIGEGKSEIRLQFWQNASYLGQMSIITTVYSQGNKPNKSSPPKTSKQFRGKEYTDADLSPTADLNIIIEHTPDAPPDKYRIGIMSEQGIPEFLGEVPPKLVFMSEDDLSTVIESLNEKNLTDDQIRNRMINAGRDLYKELFPEDSPMRSKFVQILNQGIKSISILSEEEFIPWEIVRPHGSGLNKGYKEGYLCELYSFVRWRRSRMGTSQSPIKTANIVFSDSTLEDALLEKNSLIEFLSGYGIKPKIISKASTAINVITSGNYDMIHFGSHGNFQDKRGVSIPLDDDRAITPDDIVTMPDSKGSQFVFMNACSTGRQIMRFNRMNGWISKFIENGAKVFIGTSWPINQTTAKDFAQALYNNLKNGFGVGEAVRRAREVSKRDGDISHLAYVLYSRNPHIRLTFKE